MRKACVAVLAMVASLSHAACQGATYPTAVTFYKVGPGESQVTVSVGTDEPDQVPRVTVGGKQAMSCTFAPISTASTQVTLTCRLSALGTKSRSS